MMMIDCLKESRRVVDKRREIIMRLDDAVAEQLAKMH